MLIPDINTMNNSILGTWFTHTSESIMVVSPDGIIQQVNTNAANLVGRSPQQLIGDNISSLLPMGKIKETSNLPINICLPNAPAAAAPLNISCIPLGQKEPGFLVFIRPEIPEGRVSLEHDKELLEVTLASISEGVIATDNNSRVIFINQVAAKLLGYKAKQAMGRQLFDLFNHLQIPDTNRPLEDLLAERVSIEFADNIITINRNNQEKILANSAATIFDRQGNPAGLVMIFRDITDKVLAERQLAYLRFHDKLTGVYNRDYVDHILQEWDNADMLPLSLVLGDVNGLKLTNDIFGHLEGDRLLVQVASIMQQACREQDIVARWGGDEFVILMPGTSLEENLEVCQTISRLCDQAIADPIKVSISLGMATRNNLDTSMDAIFKDAEDLMYHLKLQETEASRQDMVESIKRSLWSRSQETEDHCSRIGYLLRQMGSVVWLDKKDKQQLSTLAQLHDIGKICVPSDILSRRGSLSPGEWEPIRRHPEHGHRIALAIRETVPLAEAILAHHERWDGTGYPQGLADNDIPILARMLAIADAYDVMVHDSPYKPAISRSQALEEIKKGAGKQFDPALARIFYELFSRPEINRH